MLSYLLSSVLALVAISQTTTAHPLSLAAQVGEDQPWQLTGLSINVLPSNATAGNGTSHITFAAVDINAGLEFNTTCSAFVPLPQTLYADTYTPCANRNVRFSLRQDGLFRFSRRLTAEFGGGYCFGTWDYRTAKYYSDGPRGLVVFEPKLEMVCSLMSGGG